MSVQNTNIFTRGSILSGASWIINTFHFCKFIFSNLDLLLVRYNLLILSEKVNIIQHNKWNFSLLNFLFCKPLQGILDIYVISLMTANCI